MVMLLIYIYIISFYINYFSKYIDSRILIIVICFTVIILTVVFWIYIVYVDPNIKLYDILIAMYGIFVS